MTRSSRKLLLLTATLATALSSLAPLQAGCHGNSGGRSYSSRSYGSPTVYSQPYYSQPVYRQPIYPQSQPVYVQSSLPSGYVQQPYPSQPIDSSPYGVSVQPGVTSPMNPQSFPQTFPQQTTQQQFAPQQQFASPQTGLQQFTPQQSGVPQTQFQPQSQGVPSSVGSPAIAAPAGSAPASIENPVGNAQQSALQALGGFAPPQVESAEAPPQAQMQSSVDNSPVGTWSASMANGARVQLSLLADGNFTWTAVNSAGNASTFQGTYSIGNGTLTLIRSNDNQKLTGSLSFVGASTFNFKLSDAQSASLDFNRS